MMLHWRRAVHCLLLLWSCSNKMLVGNNAVESSYTAVQSYPVTFLTEPQSQTLAVGQQLNLICQASVAPLNGVLSYTMPSITWRLNGSMDADGNQVTITTNTNTGYSSLQVQSVGPHHAGDYECLVNDANGDFITVSRKAVIQVIENVIQELFVDSGQPVQLKCGPLVPPGLTITWLHNNQPINPSDNSIVLAHGGHTLLLVRADHGDSGSWHCVGTALGSADILGAEYYITVNQGNYSGPPQVLFNTSLSNPQEGMPFTLQCLTAPDPNATVIWLQGEQGSGLSNEIAVSESHELVFEAFTSNDTGSYTCAVPDGGEIVAQATFDLQFSALPKFTIKPVTEMYVEEDESDKSLLELTCIASGHPKPSIHWIKDGVSLSMDLYNYETGVLRVAPADVRNGRLHGVYQCFAENTVGVETTVTRVLIKGLSNPPTDLVCEPTSVKVNFVVTKPQISISWSAPVPNGGEPRIYKVFVASVTYSEEKEVESTKYLFVGGNSDDVYDIAVLVVGSSYDSFVFCTVDTTDRFEKMPIPFVYDCNLGGSVQLKWQVPVIDPSEVPANNFHVMARCLHGNDSQVYDYTDGALTSAFEKEVLTDLPSGTLCLFSGSYTIMSLISIHDSHYIIPTSYCFLGGEPVSDEATPGDVRLNITCNSSTVWLSWDVPCLDIDHINITGLCLNETWEEEYNVGVNVTEVTGDVIMFSLVPAGAICSFTGFFLNESDMVEVVAPVQCIMNEYTPDAYRVLNNNFIRTTENCTSAILGKPTEQTATPHTVATIDDRKTVSALITVVIILSVVLPCSLAGIIVGGFVHYQRKRRNKCNRLEMEASAYKSTIKWSSYVDDSDTISVKTDLDSIYPDYFLQEIPTPLVPIFNFTFVDRCGFSIKQRLDHPEQREAVIAPRSALTTEIQSEDDISLDPTERWNSPVEQRPGDDSGCFLMTDKDGLSQAVSKQEIPVDKTGSSGFWSASSGLRKDMQSYHDSILLDLMEAESKETTRHSAPAGKAPSRETTQQSLPPGKVASSSLPSFPNSSSHSLAMVKGGHKMAQLQKGMPEIFTPTPVSSVVVETDSGTFVRLTIDQKCAQMVDTMATPMCKITGVEDSEENLDLGSVGSSLETLSQSSGSHEYINRPRHHLDHHESAKVQNLPNLFYTDGKGYVRFVTRSTEVSLPVPKQ